MENRAFNEMKKAALEWLKSREPEEIAVRAGCYYDVQKRLFHLKTLGKDIEISYPEGDFSEELEEWHQLVALHYLYVADGMLLSGKWVTFGNLKDGLIRGTKFDQTIQNELQEIFKDKQEEEIFNICKRLGGVKIPGKGDLCIKFDFFPRYPVMFSIWFADEEFPLSVKTFVDADSDHYLTIEDAVTLGGVLVEALAK